MNVHVEFREVQGISGEAQDRLMHTGFIIRGKSLKFMSSVSKELSALRRSIRDALLKAGKRSEVEDVEGNVEAATRPTSSVFQDGGKA